MAVSHDISDQVADAVPVSCGLFSEAAGRDLKQPVQ